MSTRWQDLQTATAQAMPANVRASNYLLQADAQELTPRQARRLRHKANRELRRRAAWQPAEPWQTPGQLVPGEGDVVAEPIALTDAMSDRAAAAIADLMVSDLQLRGYGSPHQPKGITMTEPEHTEETSGGAAEEEASAEAEQAASSEPE